jgi:hypothetical protein
MKEEKEFKWLLKLRESEFIKKSFGNKGGCKRDFEIEFRISENDKEFRRWLDLLIIEEVLEVFEVRKVGYVRKPVNTYIINKNKLDKKLNDNKYYQEVKKIVEEGHIVI